MKKTPRDGHDMPDLDRLIEEIGADAHGNDEKFWAFRQAFEDNIPMPCDGFVIGEPISVLEFDYDGNERCGLTARCRRSDGSEHVVAALDVMFSGASSAVRYLTAYRRWLGLDPFPSTVARSPHRARQHKAAATDLDMKSSIELVVLAVKENAVRCGLPGTDRVITLRAIQPWNAVPGEIVVVRPNKQWRYAGHPYLSGVIESVRLDVAALAVHGRSSKWSRCYRDGTPRITILTRSPIPTNSRRQETLRARVSCLWSFVRPIFAAWTPIRTLATASLIGCYGSIPPTTREHAS